jgi:pimeloyl-ACP methyl ester carboxylesterase
MASDRASWRSDDLGPSRTLRLRQGNIRYHEAGTGPAIVFVHGALVNANLWRRVVPALAGRFRCMALDLPLGAHLEPMPPAADLSPPALADLIADAIEELDLEDVTLVGNDTGGALCQLVVTRRPDQIGALVLTSCDAFDNFPPKAMQPAMPLLKVRGVIPALLAPVRLRALRHRLLTLTRITKRPVEPAAADSYALPPFGNAGVMRDLKKFLVGLDKRYTLEAATRLPEFDRPALIAWSREDKLFPPRYAKQLADTLPNARLEWIDDSYTFSPEDRPERVAELVADLAGDRAGARAA